MKCYLCGSENHFKREGKVREDHNINILECRDCGLVFLDKQNTGDAFYENNNMIDEKFFETTKLYLFPFNFMKMNWYKEQLEIN